jgi:tetratricopeptide (TPR) repeat protein
MPRYDRIGPLAAPERERTFSGWLALRDLDGRERDADLVRRARLRFLAIRPVRRLLERGIDNVPIESFERQIEGIREELGHLPARDPERVRLSQFLHRIGQRTPLALVTATIDIGEIAEAAGHYHGAGEYYQTALEITDKYGLPAERILALRLLARVARKQARWEEAESHYRRAAQLALDLGDRQHWARSMDGLGIAFRCQGSYPRARKIFTEVMERGRDWSERSIIALAANSLSITEMTAGNPESALAHGWEAISLMQSEEEKNPVLGNLGAIFVQLGMFEPAEHCFEIIVQRSSELITRWQAAVEYASLAARRGDAAAFAARRDTLMKEEAAWSASPWLVAYVHTELGRGALLAGDPTRARAHLKAGQATAERNHFNEILLVAEELAGQLSARTTARTAITKPEQGGSVAERIAGELREYRRGLVPAGV